MLSDSEILAALERLRDEWADLLGDDAATLARRLGEMSADDPESVRQTANRVLDLLDRHPPARARVRDALGVKGDLRALRAAYDSYVGAPNEIPAGTLVVCPQDPTHYRRRLRQKGQALFCSEHGVALVPADSLPAEE